MKGEKGDKGDTGATGSAGKDGTSVTVKSVNESTDDGGINVVTFSDGKTVTIKNGSKGSTGSKGDKGDKGDAGEPGKDGSNGKDGSDGFSPSVAVEEIDGGHRITITDKDGGKTFDVMDGQDSEGGSGGIPYIVGDSTTAGTWTGTCEDITEYYEGLTVLYKVNIEGASTTTLNINDLGAV